MHKCPRVCSRVKDVLLEPIVLGFTLFIAFEHIRYVYNTADYAGLPSRVGNIMTDIANNAWVYVLWLGVVVWWAVWKYKSVNRGNGEISKLTDAVDANTQKLALLVERMDKLISKWEKDDA